MEGVLAWGSGRGRDADPAVFSLAPQSLLGAVLEVSLAVTDLAAKQEGQ